MRLIASYLFVWAGMSILLIYADGYILAGCLCLYLANLMWIGDFKK
jgi:hypothetical protein